MKLSEFRHYRAQVEGKQAVVTGGNSGIGFEVAKALACAGAHVVVASRNAAKSEEAVEELRIAAGRARSPGTVDFLPLDLSSLRSVQQFVTALKGRSQELHILVNNAAVWCPADSKTVEGMEAQVGPNYFGTVYLTELLLTTLRATARTQHAPTRIVWITSASEVYGDVDWDDLTGEHKRSDFKQYSSTKLMGFMAARYLAQQYHQSDSGPGVQIFGAQPGASKTGAFTWGAFDPWKPAAFLQVMAGRLVGLPASQGALAAQLCCLQPATELTDMRDGVHYGPTYSSFAGLPLLTNKGLASKQHVINAHALNLDECRRLYEATLQILKDKESASSTRHPKK
ncbi:hypothetical protein WJX84_012012 [Apatococcus fuscideae]|uniref:Uncharacterized protein n=1 Tax=Apatococcus fuscideae TaxID=2026836 RepID=A0AAW1TAQ1_9CHLO